MPELKLDDAMKEEIKKVGFEIWDAAKKGKNLTEILVDLRGRHKINFSQLSEDSQGNECIAVHFWGNNPKKTYDESLVVKYSVALMKDGFIEVFPEIIFTRKYLSVRFI